MRKGIILAGGDGSRLFPLTFSVTKQLLPIHDKPMIYYPLSTLLELEIKNILIICKEKDKLQLNNLLGDGSNFGITLSYLTQNKPNGIAEGLVIAEDFLSGDDCVFILGDNLFIGQFESKVIKNELYKKNGATIFSYKVNDPERYGVVILDKNDEPKEIFEKPKKFISEYAITGIYFYDQEAVNIAKTLKPSKRKELEITDVNKHYLSKKLLRVVNLDKNITWLDAGTISSFYDASHLVSTIEIRTGRKIACLEEISFSKKFISLDLLKKNRERYGPSNYGKYLEKIINKNF